MYDFFMTNFKDVIEAQCNKAREESREKWLQKGKQEEAIQIALNMLQEKLQLEFISKMTKLSLEQLKKLQLQLNQSH